MRMVSCSSCGKQLRAKSATKAFRCPNCKHVGRPAQSRNQHDSSETTDIDSDAPLECEIVPDPSEAGTLPPTTPLLETPTVPPSASSESATVPPRTPKDEDVTVPPRAVDDDEVITVLPSRTSSRQAERETPQIPGYEILGELGRGGMGVVYKARHEKLNRTVALKMILSGGYASDADISRFLSEAEAVAAFQHPNIVQVFEVGHHQGLPFMALEFVDGGSLGGKLEDGPLPATKAARMVEQIARGMNAAHQGGIVHRDLKPDNVLLGEDGTPKVTDFGLAKRVEGESGLTQTGTIMGTPSYMAPEQASGEGKRVGPAADVYALGAILYCCLTGKPPFQAGSPLDTILQVVSEEPKPPSQFNPKIPKDLETICLKCLNKEPGKRYANAEAMAEDLRRYLHDEPITARPVSRTERAVKWVKRNTALALSLAAVVLVLVLGAGVSAWQAIEARTSEAKAKQKEAEAIKSETKAKQSEAKAKRSEAKAKRSEAKAKDNEEKALVALEEVKRQKQLAEANWTRAEWKVYAANINFAQTAWRENRADLVRRYLGACRKDFRGWEHDYLWTLLHSNQTTFKGHRYAVNSVAYSPDGARIVSASNDKTLKVWDASTGEVFFTLEGHKSGVQSVAYSPDGKRIVSGGNHIDKTAKVWNAETGEFLHNLEGRHLGVYSVAFSPDSTRIVGGSGGESVKVWDATTGQAIFVCKGHKFGILCVAYSPDGKRIVSSSYRSLKVWDATTGKEIALFKGDTWGGYCVAYSPDGKRIVSGPGHVLKVWDATTGEELATFTGHTQSADSVVGVSSVAFSPDGTRIVSGSGDRTVKVWDAETGETIRTLKGHTEVVYSVAFSPDGKHILSGSGDKTLKVWDAAKNQETLAIKGESRFTSAAFGPESKRIVGGIGKSPNVWEVATGEVIFTLDGHTEYVSCVAYSPDGKRIASGSGDGTLRVWDARTGKELAALEADKDAVQSVAFSPDGTCIVSGGNDKTVRVWNATTGKQIGSFEGHSWGIRSVVYSPDGKRIFSSGNPQLKVWDAKTGKELDIFKGFTSCGSLAISPDGKRIVSGTGRVKVWDATTGQTIFTLQGHTAEVHSVAYSPDGTRIVTAGKDKTVRVWDATTGQETITLKGHAWEVNTVAFSPDGTRIVSGSGDRTLKVWDGSGGIDR